MSAHNLTEFEKARARKLAQELRDKMEEYFPREMTDAEHAEIRGLREELEKMGFHVKWTMGVSVDEKTGAITPNTEVTLLIPKERDSGARIRFWAIALGIALILLVVAAIWIVR